jgi:hypothetical protein
MKKIYIVIPILLILLIIIGITIFKKYSNSNKFDKVYYLKNGNHYLWCYNYPRENDTSSFFDIMIVNTSTDIKYINQKDKIILKKKSKYIFEIEKSFSREIYKKLYIYIKKGNESRISFRWLNQTDICKEFTEEFIESTLVLFSQIFVLFNHNFTSLTLIFKDNNLTNEIIVDEIGNTAINEVNEKDKLQFTLEDIPEDFNMYPSDFVIPNNITNIKRKSYL